MTSYKIQFRLPEFRRAVKGDEEWRDIASENYHVREHAELRKASFWENHGFPLEFRVTEEKS